MWVWAWVKALSLLSSFLGQIAADLNRVQDQKVVGKEEVTPGQASSMNVRWIFGVRKTTGEDT